MAECNYCGEPLDSVRRAHSACEQSFELGERQIAMEVAAALAVGGDLEGLPSRIATVAGDARVPEERARELVVASWARAIEKFQDTKVLDEGDERRLIRLEYLFGLTQVDVGVSDLRRSA